MGLFDAVNHAMTAIATGGFGTKDASIGYFDSIAMELVLIVSMTCGALPLMFFARLFMMGPRAIKHEYQAPTFLLILALAIAASTAWRFETGDVSFARALRDSAFNVTSILTDTGFATTDFSAWGTGAIAIYFLLYFVGGCAGSTAGAIKVFRWQILFKAARQQFVGAFSPNRVLITNYAGRDVDSGLLNSVRNFFFVYIMTWASLSACVMLTGVDFLSSTSSVAQAMAGAGPGLGPLVGPATTFAAIPAVAKWLLALAMILGRLELTTVYVLLTREFWRD